MARAWASRDFFDAAWTASDGLRIFQGACTPYGAASPYSVFRPLLRVGSGIDLHADTAEAGVSLARIVRLAAPHLLPMLPLLAVPFGAHVAPTPEADAVDPQFRRDRIHDLVVDFLDTVLGSPVLLVVEDLHWIDEASGELLNHLMTASASRPWAGVLTRRPSGPWTAPDNAPHVRRLDLEPLTDDDIRSIAIEVSERDLSDAELALVVARSGGNPLFTIELTRALEHGTIEELPESIEGLISTRIDALPGQQRHLLRVAAVFGREFDLLRVSAVGDDDLTVTDGLDELIEHDRDSTFRFRHAMYRDVAYEGLPFRERRRLHERTGQLLESEIDDPTQIASLLSLHFAAAGRHPDAYFYAIRAAANATDAYAHAEAIEQYERALRAGRHCHDVDAEARARLHEQLGRSKEFSGDLVGAEASYRRVGRLTHDIDLAVNCLRRRARVRQKQRQLTASIRLLRQAERRLADVEPEPWVHRRLAEIHLNLSGLRMDQGRLAEARREGEFAQAHAEAAGDRHLTVQAYGAIVGALTDWSDAEPYVELGLGPESPDDAYEARSILAINLGMAAFFAGRWTDAVDLYEQGRSNAQAIGNVTGAALASMNAAEVLVDQGHLERAAEALVEVRRVLGAAGYAAALLYAELLHATALYRLGDTGTAIEMLERCESEFRAGSMQLYALESLLRLAEAKFVAGSPGVAADLAKRALEEAPTVARSAVIEARALRLLGLVSADGGDPVAARERLDSAIRTCDEGDLRFELALGLAARAGITGDDDDALAAALIFDELGTVEAGRPQRARAWLPGPSP